MNLAQTIQALEANNIVTALDCGVHQYCDVNSNCPLAVELRRIVTESELTLEQLLEGYAASQEPPPNPLLNPEFPEIDGHTIIHIGESDIPLDLTPVIGNDASFYSSLTITLINPMGTSEPTHAHWVGSYNNVSAQIVLASGAANFLQGNDNITDVQFLWSGGSTFKAQGDITVWKRRRT